MVFVSHSEYKFMEMLLEYLVLQGHLHKPLFLGHFRILGSDVLNQAEP